jgi:hypothetical protein
LSHEEGLLSVEILLNALSFSNSKVWINRIWKGLQFATQHSELEPAVNDFVHTDTIAVSGNRWHRSPISPRSQ